MRRIGLAVILTVGLSLAPLAGEAQQSPTKTARIGYLSLRQGSSHLEESFLQGLRELGYVEGQNLSLEYRWADWKHDRLLALAEDLVRRKVDVIVATGGPVPALAAKKATKTIPIIFTAGDPVGQGIVASLDRPGGNLTGISVLSSQLNSKRLEILKEVVPGTSRVAVLANPANPPAMGMLKELEDAARKLKIRLQVLAAREPREIDDAFSTMMRERPGALLVVSDPMLFGQRERIVELTRKSRVPAAYEWREFVEAGGLMSYGATITDLYRRLATYVDKILKGAKPADLPVEQPTKFELVINLKTAKALRLTIPQTLLLRADEIIQ